MSAPFSTYRVSVVVPCHNYGRFLSDCLQSIVGQTLPPHEVIVVDDCSSDNTPEVAAKFRRHNVRYRRQFCGSVLKARLAGLPEVSGDLLCYVDADDAIEPDYLEQGEQLFHEDYRIGVIYSDVRYTGLMQGTTCFPPDTMHGDLHRNNFIHAGSLVRMSALRISAAMEHPPHERYLEDWLTWRLLTRHGYWGVKQSSHYIYRRHAESLTVKNYWTPSKPTYYELAACASADVTIAVLAGSSTDRCELLEFLRAQTRPRSHTQLLVLDLDGGMAKQRADFFALGYEDVRYASLTGRLTAEPADSVHREYEICRFIAENISSPYFLFLDQNILPQPDAIERLLRCMCEGTASVSANLPLLDGCTALAKDLTGRPFSATRGEHPVHSNAFACTLLRTAAFREAFYDAAPCGMHDAEGRVESPEEYFYEGLRGRDAAKLEASTCCRFAESQRGIETWQGAYDEQAFDEEYYFRKYPDVQEAVRAGRHKSGFEHYETVGRKEQRIARAKARQFDERFYLRLYPDVKEAVQLGQFVDGFEHFLMHGKEEGRKACFYTAFPKERGGRMRTA